MADQHTPGVLIDEHRPRPQRIPALSTSLAAFVGETERGPTRPLVVTSWADYEREFGGYIDRPPFNRPNGFLPYAVRGFFDNGGRRAAIVRIVSAAPMPAGLASDGADLQLLAAPPALADYVGDTPSRSREARGLSSLSAIADVSMVVAPEDVAVAGLREVVIDHCERAKYRFAVLSADEGLESAEPLQPSRRSSFAALYCPWVRVAADHTAAGHRLVPPAGHIAGIYARVDLERGVHKAPANESVRGLFRSDGTSETGPLAFTPTSAQAELLTARGVNVVRDFRAAGRDVRVWGARTMTAGGAMPYVNVRRLLIFLEQSIDLGTRWVAFEPNDERTWASVRTAVNDFLTTAWRQGALVGSTANDAFFVKCDRTTMTQDDIAAGRLVCLIGVAPQRPAEFVVVRIGHATSSSRQ